MLTPTHTPRAAAAYQRFSKQELYEELAWFMPAFAGSVERLYGTGAAVLMRSGSEMPYTPDLGALQCSPLWQSLSHLYDYAVDGLAPENGDLGDGSFADAEMFILGLGGLASYLAEDEGGIPALAQQTLLLAQARRILDGDDEIFELNRGRPIAHLTRQQFALLAGVDVTVVDGLIQEERSDTRALPKRFNNGYIHIEAARRWLTTHTSFVPTQHGVAGSFRFATKIQVDLPADIVRALNDRAARSGQTPFQLLRSVLADEIANDCLYGSAPLLGSGSASQGCGQ